MQIEEPNPYGATSHEAIAQFETLRDLPAIRASLSRISRMRVSSSSKSAAAQIGNAFGKLDQRPRCALPWRRVSFKHNAESAKLEKQIRANLKGLGYGI